MSPSVPTFGTRSPGRRYVVRRAAYAVIWSAEGRIATVKTRRGHLLPGGGIEAGEDEATALIREVREECARAIALGARLAEAIEFFRASRGHFEGHHAFFAGAFASEPEGVGEHELVWLDLESARARLFHASHSWAIGLGRGGAR